MDELLPRKYEVKRCHVSYMVNISMQYRMASERLN